MQIHDTINGLRADLNAVRNQKRVALVPTMGNLHDGHITLMKQAREHADIVVATIFVNRLQFRPGDDFEKYPRTFAADCERLREAGVDFLFAPNEAEMYPRPQGYHVIPPVEQDTILEGEFRPGHFTGVATVVMKLFQIAQPDAALFGKKDYQQLMVIRNMVADLNLPIEIVGGETIRAADGLALSSRNGYLSAAERAEAVRLPQAITAIINALRAGKRDFNALEQEAMNTLRDHQWQPDYVSIRRQADLQPPQEGDTQFVVVGAAKLGTTRLIDNMEA